MTTLDKTIAIKVDQEHLTGTVVRPAALIPGVLLVHGWGGTQMQYLALAKQVAALGCVCLTFDLRGHGGSDNHQDTVTREDNLRDVIAAYDVLVKQPYVDKN